ncbi:GEVED domain-containing protein, partial [Flavobacterium sp. W22_SRS_FK3]|uniref:GEVED domain-containing protein n=1 Tax=Flavobacterium sp. W22_SRS_FK3 TaxID=3240275 RepID=UPI003F92EE37
MYYKIRNFRVFGSSVVVILFLLFFSVSALFKVYGKGTDQWKNRSINNNNFDTIVPKSIDAIGLNGISSSCFVNTISRNTIEAVYGFDNTLTGEGGSHGPIYQEGLSFNTTSPKVGSASLIFNGNSKVQYNSGNFMTKEFDELSIGFWIKIAPSQITTDNRIIYEEGNKDDGLLISIRQNGKLRASFSKNGNQRDILFTYPQDGQWHHVGVTYINNNISDGLASIYLDGEVKESKETGLKTIRAHDDGAGLGGRFGTNVDSNTSKNFIGELDEFFYSYNYVSGGDILNYVQCLNNTSFNSTYQCEDKAFRSDSGKWYSFSLETSEDAVEAEVINPLLVNAGGYNDNDGMIYSLSKASDVRTIVVISEIKQAANGKLTFINHEVGPIVGLGTSYDLNAGDVYDNKIYVRAYQENKIFVIDIDKNSPNFLKLISTVNLTGEKGADLAMHPETGEAWVIDNNSEIIKIHFNFNGNIGVENRTNYGKIRFQDNVAGVNNGPFGAQYVSNDNIFYFVDNDTGNIFNVNLSNLNTTDRPNARFLAKVQRSANNDGARCHRAVTSLDFGDAPSSYGTLLDNSGARHSIKGYNPGTNKSSLMLGNSIDREVDGFPNDTASGDDDSLNDDENAFNILPSVDGNDSDYILTNIPVVNTSGKVANLYAWIDFNKNGSFDDDEFAFVTVPNNATKVILSWNIPFNMASGSSYARFRLTTGILSDSDTGSSDSRAVGDAIDGEVEDYKLVLGCTTIPAPLLEDIKQPSCSSDTGSFKIKDPVAGYSYFLDGQKLTNVGAYVTGLTPGNYSLTVTNADGCISQEKEINIISISPLEIQSIKKDITCFGGSDGSISIQLSGGTAPYSYSWSTSEGDSGLAPTQEDQTGLVAGSYTVQVTDAKGCIAEKTIILTQPNKVANPSVNTSPAGCDVENSLPSGSVTLTHANAGSFTYNIYSISDNNTSWIGLSKTLVEDINFFAGVYRIISISNAGCESDSVNFTITQTGGPASPQVNSLPAECGEQNGSFTITNFSGNLTYYLDNIKIQNPHLPISAQVGSHSLVAQNSEGCAASSEVVIGEKTAPEGPLVVYKRQPTCVIPTGDIEISLSNLPSNSMFRLDILNSSGQIITEGNFQNSNKFNNLSIDNIYQVVFKAGNCESKASRVVFNTLPPLTKPSVTLYSASCDRPYGTITVNDNNPDSYTYTLKKIGTTQSWEGNYTELKNKHLDHGEYTLSRSVGSCESPVHNFEVIVPVIPNKPTITRIDATCDTRYGSILVTGNDANSFSYNLQNLSNPNSAPQQGISKERLEDFQLSSGSYALSAQNESCVSEILNFTIVVPEIPVAPVVTPADGTCEIRYGTIDIGNAASSLRYTLKNENGNVVASSKTKAQIEALQLQTGNYTITAYNGSCNSVNTEFTINMPPVPQIPEIDIHDTDCDTSWGYITVRGQNTALNKYNLTGGGLNLTNLSVSQLESYELQPGTYELYALNTENCISPLRAFTINPQPQTPPVPILNITNATCSIDYAKVNYQDGYNAAAYRYSLYRYSDDGSLIQKWEDISSNDITNHQFKNGSYTLLAKLNQCFSEEFEFIIRIPEHANITNVRVNNTDCDVRKGSIELLSSNAGSYTYTLVDVTLNSQQENLTKAQVESKEFEAGSYQLIAFTTDCESDPYEFTIDTAPVVPDIPIINTTPVCGPYANLYIVNFSDDVEYYLNDSPIPYSSLPKPVVLQSEVEYILRAESIDGCSVYSDRFIIPRVTNSAPINVNVTNPTCIEPYGRIQIINDIYDHYVVKIPGGYNLYTGPAELIESRQFDPTMPYYTIQGVNSANCLSSSMEFRFADVVFPSKPVLSITQPNCAIATGKIKVTNHAAEIRYKFVSKPEGTDTFSGEFTKAELESLDLISGEYILIAINTQTGCESPITTFIINASPSFTPVPTLLVEQGTCATPYGSVKFEEDYNPAAYRYYLYRYDDNGDLIQKWEDISSTDMTNHQYKYGNYELYAIKNGLCGSELFKFSIQVPQIPVQPAITRVQPTCDKPSGRIIINNNSNFILYKLLKGSQIITQGSSKESLEAIPLQGGSYTLFATTFTNLPDGTLYCDSPGLNFTINSVGLPQLPILDITNATCSIDYAKVNFQDGYNAEAYRYYLYRYDDNGDLIQKWEDISSTNITNHQFKYGNYKLRAKLNQCLSEEFNFHIKIPVPVNIPNVRVNNTDCNVPKGSIDLLSSNADSYTYTLLNITTNTQEKNLTKAQIETKQLSPGSYQLIASNADCDSEAFSFIINPRPDRPLIPAINVNVVCGSSFAIANFPEGYSTEDSYHLEWRLDGVLKYTWTNISPNDLESLQLQSGTYILMANGEFCKSNALDFTINTDIANPLQVEVLKNCYDVTGRVKVTNHIEGVTYKLTTYYGGVIVGEYLTVSQVEAIDLPPSRYILSAKNEDIYGCLNSKSFIIPERTAAIPEVEILQPNCNTLSGHVLIENHINNATYDLFYIPSGYAPVNLGFSITLEQLQSKNLEYYGSYSLRMKNGGCQSPSIIFYVIEPSLSPAPVVSVTHPDCEVSTGFVKITTSAEDAITYTLTGPSLEERDKTKEEIENLKLPQGIYSLVTNNSEGCPSEKVSFIITRNVIAPDKPEISVHNPDCITYEGSITIENKSPQHVFYTLINISTGDLLALFESSSYIEGLALLPSTYELTAKTSSCESEAKVFTIDRALPPVAPLVDTTNAGCDTTQGSFTITNF